MDSFVPVADNLNSANMKSDGTHPCPEDDGMCQLRAKVHEINRTHSTHQARGAALLALMRERPQALSGNTASASSAAARTKLPETIAVAPRLEALPVELIESIVQHFTPSQFSSFRLSSPWLRSKSLYAFRQRFFTERTVILDSSSLLQLARIRQHELFGPVLKDLIILAEDETHFCRTPRTAHNVNQARSLGMMLGRVLEGIPSLRCLSIKRHDAISSVLDRHDAMLSSLALPTIFLCIASSTVKIESLAMGDWDAHKTTSYVHHRLVPNPMQNRLSDVLRLEALSLTRNFAQLKRLEFSWNPIMSGQTAPVLSAFQLEEVEQDFPNALLRLTPNLKSLLFRDARDYYGAFDSTAIPLLDFIRVPLRRLATLELHMWQRHLTKASISRFLREVGGNIQKILIRPVKDELRSDTGDVDAKTLARRLRFETGLSNIDVVEFDLPEGQIPSS